MSTFFGDLEDEKECSAVLKGTRECLLIRAELKYLRVFHFQLQMTKAPLVMHDSFVLHNMAWRGGGYFVRFMSLYFNCT